MASFQIEFYAKANKDLEKLHDKKEVLLILKDIQDELSQSPWPFGKKKKKIRGISYSLYRLRVDTGKDSYRIFYLVELNKVVILRVVRKKEADKVINRLR